MGSPSRGRKEKGTPGECAICIARLPTESRVKTSFFLPGVISIDDSADPVMLVYQGIAASAGILSLSLCWSAVAICQSNVKESKTRPFDLLISPPTHLSYHRSWRAVEGSTGAPPWFETWYTWCFQVWLSLLRCNCSVRRVCLVPDVCHMIFGCGGRVRVKVSDAIP
jgi:hypothetical protein